MRRLHRVFAAVVLAAAVLQSAVVNAAGPEDFSPSAARRSKLAAARLRAPAPSTARADQRDRVRLASAIEPEYRAPIERNTAPRSDQQAPYQEWSEGADVGYESSYPSYDYGFEGESCDSCSPCDDCRHGPFYARGEYLLWWLKGDSLPPLVTSSPQGTLQPQAGVLDQPHTTILFGGDRVNDTARSGGRVVIGKWLDPCHRIEGEWFGLEQKSTDFSQTSNGNPILARPFFNLTSGLQDANLVAFPNFSTGTLDVRTSSSFSGAGVFGTHLLSCVDDCDCQYRIDFLCGFRYLRLRENLSVSDTLTSSGTAAPVGTEFTTNDSFTTTNNFYGGTLGLIAESRVCRWCFTGVGRVSLGGTNKSTRIAGNSRATVPDEETAFFTGGLLALPTNIGSYARDGFTVVPELQLKVAYDVNCCLRLFVGYDLIYWSRVARPGEQVDLFVNTSQASGQPLVGTPGPLFPDRVSDLWVQGITVGGELRY